HCAEKAWSCCTRTCLSSANRSDGIELQQPCDRNPGLLLHLTNSCIVSRFMIFATAGDSLPDAIVGAPEDIETLDPLTSAVINALSRMCPLSKPVVLTAHLVDYTAVITPR